MYVDPELLRRLDNAIRFDLESWRVMFFHCLIGASMLVAIGVGLEGPEVIHEVRNIWRNPKQEAKSRIKLIGLVGWVLVVVGVIGEGIFEGAFSVSDGQIQTFDEILLTDAQRQVLSAEAANIQLGIDLAKAKADLAKNQTGLDKERHETAEIEEDAAEMQIDVQHNVLELTTPRLILQEGANDNGDEIRKARYEEIKKYNGTPVLIQVVTDDPNSEPRRLAESISYALKSAGWNPAFTDEKTPHMPSFLIGPGVKVLIPENSLPPRESPSYAASALVRLFELDLKQSGVSKQQFQWKNLSRSLRDRRALESTVLILVGPKPLDLWWPTKRQPAETKAMQTKTPAK
jgi:hypothetical protein